MSLISHAITLSCLFLALRFVVSCFSALLFLVLRFVVLCFSALLFLASLLCCFLLLCFVFTLLHVIFFSYLSILTKNDYS